MLCFPSVMMQESDLISVGYIFLFYFFLSFFFFFFCLLGV